MLWNRVGCKLMVHQTLRTSIRNKSTLILQKLSQRCAVKIKGNESDTFLQGLITNDIKHLEHKNSIYSMILNAQGRILYETIIYKGYNNKNNDEFILDCDKTIAEKLANHLDLYTVRKEIDIQLMQNYHIFVVYQQNQAKIDKLQITLPQGCLITTDPRLENLGNRLLVPNESIENLESQFDQVNKENDGFRELRYRLGVAEGPSEIPHQKALPHEYNIAYLNGVSFHKGCYIGQELTARVHHTGTVRKRIMPIEILDDNPDRIEENTSIVNEDGKKIGQLKAYFNGLALAMMRIEETSKAKEIKIQDLNVQVTTPHWWQK